MSKTDFWDLDEVDRLREFRKLLVARRRSLVEEAFQERADKPMVAPDYGSHRGSDVKIVQEQIEAIDRAIDDERRLKGPDFQAFVA